MMSNDFEIGDLVEVVKIAPPVRRVLAGTSPTIANGDQGIVTEKYRSDLRVQCGSNTAMRWEANVRADEVRLISRLGREEANRRLFAPSPNA